MVARKMMFFFLCFAHSHALWSKDFGVHGKISPIEEHDPIVLIQSKLKDMEERGELKRHNFELQKKTRAAIEHPRPVEGITKLAPELHRGATESRVSYYDPTYAVKEDIKDHKGQIIHLKGTQINPLKTVSLSHSLLFFDGDDPEQVAWAKQKQQSGQVKFILIKGAPLALSEEWHMPVYFDQVGLLTKKLGVKHIPTFVSQDGTRLRIEEIQLQSSDFATRHGVAPEASADMQEIKGREKE